MSKEFTHLTEEGAPGMVDVSHKMETTRIATASGKVIIPADVLKDLRAIDFNTGKGSIVQTAIIAATMAIKNTYNTIPLCHQIPISSIKVFINDVDDGFAISCRVKSKGITGVEMEALHGVSVAGLTIYDMCKAKSHDIKITDIQLDSKTGGKSDYERKA